MFMKKDLLGALMVLGLAGGMANATTVTLVGDLQSELGCSSDYDTACAASHLELGSDAQVWRKTFTLPAGNYQYFVALDDNFNTVYGAGGVSTLPVPQVALGIGGSTAVRFYYDSVTHWATDNVKSVIATLAGDFQSELACAGDFDPTCLRSWLKDLDGYGIYQFEALLPLGQYSFVLALNENFVTNGKQYYFGSDGTTLSKFRYDPRSGNVTINDGDVSAVPIPA
jgi:pullulanase